MKRINQLIAIAALCVVAFSCKNSGTTGLPIPKDAVVVMHINTKSLTSKLSWKEIRETSWFQEARQKADDSFSKKLLDNPESSGVDINSDFAYFIKKQGRGGYMVFEGKVKDAALFETAVKNMDKGAAPKKDGDLNYVETSSKSVLCWNDHQFFAMADMPMSGMNPFMRRYDENEMSNSFGSDSLRKFTKDLLALKSDDNIDHDDRFASMLKEGGDVHVWVGSDSYASSMTGGMMSMLKIGSLIQGNVGAFTLSFDDGKISVKAKSYFGEEMKKLMEKYKPSNVEASLINRIPSNDVAGVLAANMDPGTIREFLKASGLDGMANAYLSRVNYSIDELVNATGGKFLFAVSDLHVKPAEPGLGGMSARPDFDMNVLFASSVHDRASFDKMLNIIQQQTNGQPMPANVNYKVTNDWFAYSNHPAPVDAFLSGTAGVKQPFTDRITGHPLGLYIDLQRIFKAHQGSLENAADSVIHNASIALWQDVVMTGGEYSGGSSTSNLTINLVDKSTNSLKQLNQYAEKMNAAEKLRRSSWEDMKTDTMPQTDSVAMPPAMAPQSN